MIKIYSEFFIRIVEKHSSEMTAVKTQADVDAKTILEMMMTKVMYLQNLLKGIEFDGQKGHTLNNCIDPVVVAGLVRNVYETAALFNMICINTNGPDETSILYHLWAWSGLKYRQRFKTIAKDPENTAKVESEREDIELCIKTIKDSELYKRLDEKNQSRINKAIEDKKYHIGFEGLEIKNYDWQKLTDVMRIKGVRFLAFFFVEQQRRRVKISL